MGKDKKYFVQEMKYTSTDWHDMATVYKQLKENGSYEIQNPFDFMAKTVLHNLLEFNIGLTVDDLKSVMDEKKRITVAVPDVKRDEDGFTSEPQEIEVFSDREGHIGYHLNFEYDYTYLYEYSVSEIKAENVAYIVSEHIVNPGKGSDLVERIYHEPFDNLMEAEKYLKKMMEGYKHEDYRYRSESGYKLAVVDKNEIIKNPWYEKNMLALELMKNYGEDVEKYRFYRSIQGVISELQHLAYERASDTEKIAIDKGVYIRLRNFLTEEHAQLLEKEFHAGYVNSRKISDKAIILAFVDAKSENDYKEIRKALGEYEVRIKQLTEKNAKETHGGSMVCFSKGGEIGYYNNAYAIAFWEGAKENPYYKKLEYNFGTEADVFDTYTNHHMFVDELPTQELVDSYDKKYRQKQKEDAMRKTSKDEIQARLKDIFEKCRTWGDLDGVRIQGNKRMTVVVHDKFGKEYAECDETTDMPELELVYAMGLPGTEYCAVCSMDDYTEFERVAFEYLKANGYDFH